MSSSSSSSLSSSSSSSETNKPSSLSLAFTIPNLLRIANFACKAPKDCITLSLVNRIFRETMVDFHAAATIWAKVLPKIKMKAVFESIVISICSKTHKSGPNCFAWVIAEFLEEELIGKTFFGFDRLTNRQYPLFLAIESSQTIIVQTMFDYAYEKMMVSRKTGQQMNVVERSILDQIEGKSSNTYLGTFFVGCDAETLTIIFNFLEKLDSVDENDDFQQKNNKNNKHHNRVVNLMQARDYKGWSLMFHCLKDMAKLKVVIERAKRQDCLREQLTQRTTNFARNNVFVIIVEFHSSAFSFSGKKEAFDFIVEEIDKIDDDNRTLLKTELALIEEEKPKINKPEGESRKTTTEPPPPREFIKNEPMVKALERLDLPLISLFIDKAAELGYLEQQSEASSIDNGITPLMHSLPSIAASSFNTKTVDLMNYFIEKLEKANLLKEHLLNRKSSHGLTVLHFAARSTNPEVARIILQKGKEVGIAPETLLYKQSCNFRTPLHLTLEAGVSNNNLTVAQVLVASCENSAAARRYICDDVASSGGKTVLEMAQDEDNYTVVAKWIRERKKEGGDWYYDAKNALSKKSSSV